MFKIAHIAPQKAAKQAGLSDFQIGTAFVNSRSMKMRLTYKELSLLLGIVVAVIVLMVIWLSPVSAGISDAENSIDPFPKLQAVKAIVQKAHAIVQVFL